MITDYVSNTSFYKAEAHYTIDERGMVVCLILTLNDAKSPPDGTDLLLGDQTLHRTKDENVPLA